MPLGLTPPQTYASTKIDQTYCHHRQRYQQRKLRMAIRYRRRLVYLRAAFQRELDRALSAQLQKGLGLTIRLNEQGLQHAHFMAHFEFAGQQWVLTCQRHLWRCDWFFTNTDHNRVIRCTHRTLECRLCDALGDYRYRGWAANLTAA